MFESLHNTRVWQDDYQEGLEKGKVQVLRGVVNKCLAKKMSVKAIAELLDISVREVRRLAKDTPK